MFAGCAYAHVQPEPDPNSSVNPPNTRVKPPPPCLASPHTPTGQKGTRRCVRTHTEAAGTSRRWSAALEAARFGCKHVGVAVGTLPVAVTLPSHTHTHTHTHKHIWKRKNSGHTHVHRTCIHSRACESAYAHDTLQQQQHTRHAQSDARRQAQAVSHRLMLGGEAATSTAATTSSIPARLRGAALEALALGRVHLHSKGLSEHASLHPARVRSDGRSVAAS